MMDYRCARMAGFLGVFLGLLTPVSALPLRSLLVRSPAPARGVGGAAAVSSTTGQTDSQSFIDNTGRLVGIVIGAFILLVLIVLCIFTYRNRKAKKRRLQRQAEAAAARGQTSTSISRISSDYVIATRPENAKLMEGKYYEQPDMSQTYYAGQGGRGVDTHYKGSYMKP